jgi:ABC-type polysaccharide/polyol phosphate export permease
MKKEKTITIERKVRRFNWTTFFATILLTIAISFLLGLVFSVIRYYSKDYAWPIFGMVTILWVIVYIVFSTATEGPFEEETITEEIKIK